MRAALISTLSALVVAGILIIACVDDPPQAPSLDGVVSMASTYRDCPPPFLAQTSPGHAADLNGDDVICVMSVDGGGTVVIDNNARRPHGGKKG